MESICAKPAAAIMSISSRVTSAGLTPIVRSRTFSPRCAISQQMLSACPGGSLKTESTNSNATSPRRSRTCWISSTTLSAGRQRKRPPLDLRVGAVDAAAGAAALGLDRVGAALAVRRVVDPAVDLGEREQVEQHRPRGALRAAACRGRRRRGPRAGRGRARAPPAARGTRPPPRRPRRSRRRTPRATPAGRSRSRLPPRISGARVSRRSGRAKRSRTSLTKETPSSMTTSSMLRIPRPT